MTTTLQMACEYDFMRCAKCGRLCTKLEMERALGPEGTGAACPCGSLKYQPTNLVWWEWVYPRVLVYAWTLVRALGWREAFKRGQE